MNSTRFDSILHALEANAAVHPDRVVFTFLEASDAQIDLTFRRLVERSRDIARLLSQVTVSKGARVLLACSTEYGFVSGFYGCLAVGAVPVPVCPVKPGRAASAYRTFRHIITDASPVVVLGDTRTLADICLVLKQQDQACYQEAMERGSVWGAQLISLDAAPPAVATDAAVPPLPLPATDDLAYLQYTSGSLSQPKGTMISHGNIVANLTVAAELVGFDEQTVAVGWVPLFHDLGLVCHVLAPVFFGYHSVLMSPLHFLMRPLFWLQTISRFRGTHAAAPNFAYDHCTRMIPSTQKEGLDLSCWKVAGNGGEPVRQSTLDRFGAAFAAYGFNNAAFYPTYGMAESVLFVTAGKPAWIPPARCRLAQELVGDAGAAGQNLFIRDEAAEVVSCGHPGAAHELLIVDPLHQSRCRDGEAGEIWLRGPSIASGYWNSPEASSGAFSGRLHDSPDKQYLRTGDIGFMRQGELYIIGRHKEMLICRGCNIFPQDIEAFAEEAHAELRSGCSAAFSVGAVEDERIVYVAEVDPARLAASGLAAAVLARSIRDTICRSHEIVLDQVLLIKPASLPKTTSNKVQRSECRDFLHADGLMVLAAWP